jgi:hypothetical protein
MGMPLLTLKLLLVPAFLLLVSMAGRRWGASVAGWLAGLPVVAGPILFFVALEQGAPFAARAAAVSLSAVLASVAFSVAYSHVALRAAWAFAVTVALAAWAVGAWLLSSLPTPASWPLALPLAISLLTLLTAPRLFPAARPQRAAPAGGHGELACRMLAGAALTLAVTWLAGSVGPTWSGLLAVFPILGIVLAVFSHRSQGPAYAAALLRAMATGLYSFAAFCFVLSASLPLGVAPSFALASAAALAVQAGTRRRGAALPIPKA